MQLSSTKPHHALKFLCDPQNLINLFSCPAVIKYKDNTLVFSNKPYKDLLEIHDKSNNEKLLNTEVRRQQYESLTESNDQLFLEHQLDHNTEESYIDQNGNVHSFDVSRTFINEKHTNDYFIKIFNPIPTIASFKKNKLAEPQVYETITQPSKIVFEQPLIDDALHQAINETNSVYCSIAFVKTNDGSLAKYSWAESDTIFSDTDHFVLPVNNPDIWKETFLKMEPIIKNNYDIENYDLSMEDPFATTRYISIPFTINEMTAIITLFDKSEEYTENDIHKALEILNSLKSSLTFGHSRKSFSQNQTYKQTINSVSESIIIVDIKGTIITLNSAAEKITGWNSNSTETNSIQSVLKPEYEIPSTPQLFFPFSSEWHGFFKNLNNEMLELNGKTLKMKNSNGEHNGYILIFSKGEKESISFWEKFTYSHKMESIGLLAGGMAHDFNNFLTGIHNYVNLSKFCTANRQVNKYLDDASLIIDSARELTKQFLLYSKQTEPVQTVVKIDKLLHDSCRVLFSGTNIKAIHNISEQLWYCEIDEAQIFQAIGSVIINAREAMPDGGYVEISAENVHVDKSSEMPLTSGPYIKIGVKDFGQGISDIIKDQIFNPFFSTKPKNTGLGLTSAMFIMRKHNGYITFSSKIEGGTEFILYLPAKVNINNYNAESSSQKVSSGKILLMDDEHYIRFTTSELLKKKNYDVVVAADGDEVLKIYQKSLIERNPFDIVILDLTIPEGMGGVDTLKALLKLDPDVKAIASSGYSDDPIMSQPESVGFKAALCKPYRLKEFLDLISNVISS